MKALALVALSLAALALGWQAVAVTGPAAAPDSMRDAARPARLAARSVLVGAARAGQRLVAVGERGHVLLSDDQGVQWRQARVPVSVTLTAVRFVDDRHGWAVGHSGVILHSQDGGETWAKQLDGAQALQALAGFRTEDEALRQRIARLQQDGPDKPFLALHFSDALHGLAVGAYGLAFATRDGGAHWVPAIELIDNPDERHLYAIHARPDGLYLAGEQGQVWRQAPGEARFAALGVPFQGTVFDLVTGPDGSLLALSLGGKLHRSDDQGRSWTTLLPAGKASLTAGGVVAGRLLLANEAGQILVSAYGVRDFRVAALPPFPVAALSLGDDDRLLAVGPLGVQVLTLPTSAR